MMVALVQTASSLPVMLLALPAGALADIVDRRRYLLATQIWLFVVALTLSLCTYYGYTTDKLLVLFTFLLGCGAAMSMPVWAAIRQFAGLGKGRAACLDHDGLHGQHGFR